MPMTTLIGAYEAKTHLPRLLDEVEGGATYTITRHGRPVARLIGMRRGAADFDAVAAFAEARRGHTLDIPLHDAINEGRR